MRTGNIRRYSNHSWHVHGQANISCENTSTHHQFIHFTQCITMLSDSFWSNQIYIVILAAGENRRPTGSQPPPTDTMKLDLARFWNQALVLPAFDRNQVALSRVHLLCLDLRPPAFWCALERKILALKGLCTKTKANNSAYKPHELIWNAGWWCGFHLVHPGSPCVLEAQWGKLWGFVTWRTWFRSRTYRKEIEDRRSNRWT